MRSRCRRRALIRCVQCLRSSARGTTRRSSRCGMGGLLDGDHEALRRLPAVQAAASGAQAGPRQRREGARRWHISTKKGQRCLTSSRTRSIKQTSRRNHWRLATQQASAGLRPSHDDDDDDDDFDDNATTASEEVRARAEEDLGLLAQPEQKKQKVEAAAALLAAESRVVHRVCTGAHHGEAACRADGRDDAVRLTAESQHDTPRGPSKTVGVDHRRTRWRRSVERGVRHERGAG